MTDMAGLPGKSIKVRITGRPGAGRRGAGPAGLAHGPAGARPG